MTKLSINLIVALVVACSLHCQAYAQFSFGQQKKKEARITYKPLPQPIDIPNVPHYVGQAVYEGGNSNELGRNMMFHERWKAKETKPQVLDWYKGSLQGYGWKINYVNDCSLSAEKDGNTCEVIVITPFMKGGYKSEISINSMQKK
jgi:hypothetical protein